MEENTTTTTTTTTTTIINKNSKSNNNNGGESDPFKGGVEVEVNCEEEGFRGSWYTATILKPTSKKTGNLYIRYHALVSSNGVTKPLEEWVDPVLVRPIPPRELSRSFQASEEVDAYHNEGWWEGIVIEAFLDDDETNKKKDKKKKKKKKYSVYFRTSREQMVFDEADLRLHREWVHGNWVPPLEDSTD